MGYISCTGAGSTQFESDFVMGLGSNSTNLNKSKAKPPKTA